MAPLARLSLVLALCLPVAAIASAEEGPPALRFEVAPVKPNLSGPRTFQMPEFCTADVSPSPMPRWRT